MCGTRPQSDVRNQTGDFGEGFKRTCVGKTEEVRKRWIHALSNASNIVGGEDFLNWVFDDMVGIEGHLEKMESLLNLEYEDEALIVGIYGHAGIGKTSIARALQSPFSSSFQLTYFMENNKGSYNSGLDDYGLKLRLQEQLISQSLNQNGIKIYHLGAIRQWFCKLKVLIILDDVDDLKQLEALADETAWFGPGSRIIVTTKDEEILRLHGIVNTYHMDFPSSEDALEIFCRYAFRQSSPPDGFEELATRVTKLCGNLPLDLRVVGSSLLGKKEEEWEEVIRRLEYKPSWFNKQIVKRKNQPSWSNKQIVKRKNQKKEEELEEVTPILKDESSLSSKRRGKGKSQSSTGMAFLVLINLLLEIASTVVDQLSTIRKPYFARISLVMSILSVVLSIIDLTYKVRAHKARFLCKWPIPWFYYPSRRYNKLFGSFTDTVLLFCVVGHLIVSTINCSFMERGQDGPIKVTVWPLFFAIGMVISKFMEKPTNSEDILPITRMS